MFLVDTHCHLNLDPLYTDAQMVVERALEAGIDRIVVPGTDLRTSERAIQLSTSYDCVYAAVGIHPSETDLFQLNQMKELETLLKEKKVVAVGEIGLDLYHRDDNLQEQIRLLDAMLSLSTDAQKPVILHSRNALNSLIPILRNWIKKDSQKIEGFRGVFHSFEGNSEQGRSLSSLNFVLGIAGPVTYKNGILKQTLVRELGLSYLVLETDAPYLSPHPYRGQVNEPSRILTIAQKVADILCISLEETAAKTTRNAQSLFRWEFSH